MKKLIAVFLLASVSFSAMAQDEEEEKTGFRKDKLFTGGGVSVGFGSRQTVLGANPVLGYSLTDWLDAGIALNYVYSSIRDYYLPGDKLRQTLYGPGVFTRLFPARIIFVQAQYERNFSRQKYREFDGSSQLTSKVASNSLLLGGGVALGRQPGSNTFFYISMLFDVIGDINSPYVNVEYDPNNPGAQRKEIRPLIRTGVSIGLFQGRNNRDY